MLSDTSALVLFSGGQDSTTCLAWALDRFERVETVGFDYGQRHAVELECRMTILENLRGGEFPQWADRLGDDHMVPMKELAAISETAMTEDVEFETGRQGLPNTFVPGRNLLFFTYAATIAWRRGIRHLIGGMCETDYSGYPDCRDDTLKALQVTLNLGMDMRSVIHTPLMWLDKGQTFELAEDLGGQPFLNLIVENSHSCYRGERSQRHEWGYGCGACPACELRANGWRAFKASGR
ncbi:7-cyano-7-deazaguanine synthase QueC [Notoacmeibacter sp. MSK16QG-6]|uniref:7-cyano-7-deazaguanine synthase QueC n=1 Tax=Notoacmeibacter sp. MSK16QG-6 TaxID=2957982 RepID=UPI0020A025A6|nr:7-cyano-7-deazaguanine synthase QueC [Notoacmeibacter sp. MSK16QG-6]MCP1200427.1 7-cyano-7-deazaguanine synthase QueC [Notoacmeibacter sp. MSK16QG-6]